jgi:hypothetical protein
MMRAVSPVSLHLPTQKSGESLSAAAAVLSSLADVTESKAFFAIEAIDNIATEPPAFASQHDVHASIALARAGRDDLVHALAHCRSAIKGGRPALGGAILPRQPASPPLAVAV